MGRACGCGAGLGSISVAHILKQVLGCRRASGSPRCCELGTLSRVFDAGRVNRLLVWWELTQCQKHQDLSKSMIPRPSVAFQPPFACEGFATWYHKQHQCGQEFSKPASSTSKEWHLLPQSLQGSCPHLAAKLETEATIVSQQNS